MSRLEKVYGVTEQLFQLVSQPLEKEARDECIREITLLLENREQLLSDVQPPFAKSDQQLFQQIVTWNEIINNRFAEIKHQIQQDMMQLKKTKSSNQQYVNPYQGISTSDGMFYDKRK